MATAPQLPEIPHVRRTPRPRGLSPISTADADPQETREWLDSLDAVLGSAGSERAQHLIQQLEARLREHGAVTLAQPYSSYRNSVPLDQRGAYPGIW